MARLRASAPGMASRSLAGGSPGRDPPRVARRPGRRAEPLPRSRRARDRRGPASTLPNGNPAARAEVRLQAGVVRAASSGTPPGWTRGHPVVLAGDYNVVPTELDMYNPSRGGRTRCCSRKAGTRMQDCWPREGWTSPAALHPDERIYTFWDYFRQHWAHDSGLRIDHLLVNAELAPRLTAAGVDRWVRGEEHASDHAPVWVELAAKPAPSKPSRQRKRPRPPKPPNPHSARRLPDFAMNSIAASQGGYWASGSF